MATLAKRSWKFQDFVAHDANVNCIALGHKSGRVMVTGGDDKKVNLWAIGKQSCFMSLSGHTTPVDCVQFNQLEELVCAGSRAGALKVWDLEAAKLIRTLNGHKYGVKCIDFHPYGDFLVSGSADNTIKMWDTRKKGVLYTFNGHRGTVNDAKFSPDGQWIATGGEDSSIKIWDVRICRVIKDFTDHLGPVTSIKFHPHEFLLASGGTDRAVNFFDLENFNLVSSESDVGAVRCLCFNPDGDCLFAGTRDYLKIVGWEPNRLYDSVPVYWGKVSDISLVTNQLIGASFHLTNVQIYVVDLKKCKPFTSSVTDVTQCPFNPHQGIRKSFSKADRPTLNLNNRTSLDVKTIEESTSGTEPEEDATADITNLRDYNEIFHGRGLQRTPPPIQEPFQVPERDNADPTAPQVLLERFTNDDLEALSLDNNINQYTSYPSPVNCNLNRSKSNLEQVHQSRLSKPNNRIENNNTSKLTRTAQKFPLQRQRSCKDVPERRTKNNVIKHSVSEANINKGSVSSRVSNSRKNSFSSTTKIISSTPNVSKIATYNGSRSQLKPLPLVSRDIYNNTRHISLSSPEEKEDDMEDSFIPTPLDKPVGLDFNDFLPKNHNTLGFKQQYLDMSESEALGILMDGHDSIMSIMSSRQRNIKLFMNQYRNRDIKTALESTLAMDDSATLVDVLAVINEKFSAWNLDLCVLVLPKIKDLLQNKYETYITAACNTLKLILKHFGPTIRSNIQSPVGSFGVDIPREERYQKCVKCNDSLMEIKKFLIKKQGQPGIGNNFKELFALMQTSFD